LRQTPKKALTEEIKKEPEKNPKNQAIIWAVVLSLGLAITGSALVFIFGGNDNEEGGISNGETETLDGLVGDLNDIPDDFGLNLATTSTTTLKSDTKEKTESKTKKSTSTPPKTSSQKAPTASKTPKYPAKAPIPLKPVYAAPKTYPKPGPGYIEDGQVSITDPDAEALQKKYLRELEILIYGAQDVQKDLTKLEALIKTSPYVGMINIKSVKRSSKNDPNDEYIILEASKDAPDGMFLDDFKIRSLVTGQVVGIPDAVYLPFTNDLNYKQPVRVAPKARYYIISGKSPLGYSFRTNKCIGYLSQFQKFRPSLKQNCPKAIDEKLPEAPNQLNDNCLDYLNSMSSCKIHVYKSSDPVVIARDKFSKLSIECQRFIEEKTGYSNCIKLHRNDSDFYTEDWRIYLNRGTTNWKKKREIIQLLDQNDKVVSQYSY
jgi:hypothetical protein